MQAELITISAIKPNTNNPRTIKDAKFKQLVQSIKDFPEMLKLRPIVVDEEMVILGGNMRYAACKTAGLTEIYIIKANELTEDQKREFIIKDNVGFGEWNWDVLANEWDTDELEQWGLDLPIDVSVVELQAEEDDYEMPVGGRETDIVLGDFFEIGPHRLLCGDSTIMDTYDKLFGDELADMVMTDPPYNVNYQGETKEALTIMNDSMGDSAFYQFLYDFYTALGAYTKKGGAWYVWHADIEGANFRRAMQDSGLLVKQCLIWVKNSLVMGRQDYQWKHEPCLYGWKAGAAHYFGNDRTRTTVIEDKIDIKKLSKIELQKMLTEMLSEDVKTTILRADKPVKNDIHPTMKPILLLAPLIENSSKENEIVGDAFLGSGSTMVAAHQLNRRCYGLELDPRYCQVILERMIKLDPDLKIKRNGEEYILPTEPEAK